MKHVGNSVLVRVDQKVEEMHGMVIPDSVQVWKVFGEVVSAPEDAPVREGEIVHVPSHTEFPPFDRDGYRYYKIPVTDLIAVKKGENWVPLNDFVHIRKCYNDHIRDAANKIMLYFPEKYVDVTNMCELVAAGNKCVAIESRHAGHFLEAPEFSEGLHRLEYSEEFMLRESEVACLVIPE